MITFNDLRQCEVVNACDGRRLGYVYDIELDLSCGKVCAIIVPGECKTFSFGFCENLRIPWECISKIGDDIILVSVSEYQKCPDERRKKKKWVDRCGGF
jgi:YlmC/YmxH family sporulation protein